MGFFRRLSLSFSAHELFPLSWVWLLPILVLVATIASWFGDVRLWTARNAVIVWGVVWLFRTLFHLLEKNGALAETALERRLHRIPTWAFVLPFFVWAAAAQLRKFYEIDINGVDFSIFDWMLYSTHSGRLGYSPIYDVNHFGQHSSFNLLLLVPLHHGVPSSMVLCLYNLFLFCVATLPLYQLSKHLQFSRPLRLLILAVYLTNPWSTRMLTGGFMPEHGFAVGYLWFLWAVVTGKRWHLLFAVLFLFTTKEDTPFYLASCAATWLFLPVPHWQRRHWVFLLSACVAWFLLYSQWLQPVLLSQTGASPTPSYLGFWSQHGNTLKNILLNMATQPWLVVRDILHSRWLYLLGPCWLLPLFDRRTVLPILFGIFFLGSSNYSMMRDFQTYYPQPPVPFCLAGMLFFVVRKPKGITLRANVAGMALMTFTAVSGDTPRTGPFSTARREALLTVGQSLKGSSEPVYIQTIFFPHVGYDEKFFPLFELTACDQTPGQALIDLQFRSYPFPRSEIESWFERKREVGNVTLLEAADAALVRCGPGKQP